MATTAPPEIYGFLPQRLALFAGDMNLMLLGRETRADFLRRRDALFVAWTRTILGIGT